VDLHDRRLARIVRRCQELPGHELFQYVDDAGERRSIGSSDVNQYLRELTGEEFTSKDFRTWAATVLAGGLLREAGGFASEAHAKRRVARAIRSVAERLGNTAAVCRASYVHPAVIDAYRNGALPRRNAEPRHPPSPRPAGLHPDERAVVELLQRRRPTALERERRAG
jgi:DNA topoisomerase-1